MAGSVPALGYVRMVIILNVREFATCSLPRGICFVLSRGGTMEKRTNLGGNTSARGEVMFMVIYIHEFGM